MSREPTSTVRLFVDRELTTGAAFELDKPQAHYLVNVMRLAVGSDLSLFNGRDGEWRATITSSSKGRVGLGLESCTREQDRGPDLWLVQAPIKSARMKTVIEKATELGVAAILPAVTQHTAVSGVNVDRLRATAIEAAEQCGRLSVPAVQNPKSLDQLIDTWPPHRCLVFCDETRAARPLIDAVREAVGQNDGGPWGLLIGPEGGFSGDEVDKLRRQPFVIPVKLGPRILRADTAAIAALSLWQAVAGDWRNGSD